MKTNLNLKKIKTYKVNQDKLRKKAINSGVNLVAPETIFLSKDTKFGKNVTINPHVVIGKKVKLRKTVIGSCPSSVIRWLISTIRRPLAPQIAGDKLVVLY